MKPTMIAAVLSLATAQAAPEAFGQTARVKVTFTHVEAQGDFPFDTGNMIASVSPTGGATHSRALNHCHLDPIAGTICVFPEFLGFNQFVEFDVPVTGNGRVDLNIGLIDEDTIDDDEVDLTGTAGGDLARIRLNLLTNTWVALDGESFPYTVGQPPGGDNAGCSSDGGVPALCWNVEVTCTPGDTFACNAPLRECDSHPGTRTCSPAGSMGACVPNDLDDPNVCVMPVCKGGARDVDRNGNTNPDDDGDGLLDCWEEEGGIDYDGNGSIDLVLPGAKVDRKNLYVEIDQFDCEQPGGECDPMATTKFGPRPAAVTLAKTMFANAPVSNPDGSTGIDLELQIDELLPHKDLCTMDDGTDPNNCYRLQKIAFFGTAAERTNQARRFAKRVAYRYSLWADSVDTGTVVGWGRLGGVDTIIGLGSAPSDFQQARTFVHELGHNLKLDHGGGDGVNQKPNYLSVMNYRFSAGLSRGMDPPFIDYSRASLPSLFENALDEPDGIGDGDLWSGFMCPGNTNDTEVGNQKFDWNCNGNPDDLDVQSDVNGDRLCVDNGVDGILQTPAVGDDQLRGQFILAGANGVLDSMVAGDDIVVGPVGGMGPNRIWSGINGLFQTALAGDDVIQGGVIWDGPDRTCNSVAVGDDARDTATRKPNTVQATELKGYNDWAHIQLPFQDKLKSGFEITGDDISTPEPNLKTIQEATRQLERTDVQLTKVMTRGSGSDVTITITAKNIGPKIALRPVVNDRMPAGLVAKTCTSAGTTCMKNGDLYAVDLLSLSPGQQKTVTIAACSVAGANLTNTATVISETVDSNRANDTATATLNANATWATGVNYKVGDRVVFQGMVFKCLQAHPSQAGWTPTATPALWNRPAPCATSAWQTQTDYPLNHEVTFNGRRYRCKTAHVSQATWTPSATPALWQLVQ